ncbi:hypothetical protein [Flavobacterium silvisoli]|nr:hypothetical protein [Flavobacterium silvisoli]
MEKDNKKIGVQVLIFVVVFAIAFLGTKYVMSQLKSNKTKEIKESTK